MSHSFSAPGRVNLIGEHTDYTGGLVMPMAIPFSTSATISTSDDGLYHFQSDHFEEVRSMSPNEVSSRRKDWSDYPIGVLRELQALGMKPAPFHLRLIGDVPIRAGLSSSASVEVATAMALLSYCGKALTPKEIAWLCQRAENSYVGSPCGIMDQFVVTAAVAATAMLLDTRDLAFELLPLNRGDLSECLFVVANSGVKHSIAEGEYGLRRREVETGQSILCRRFPQVRDLGDASLRHLLQCRDEMTNESFRRCRHIITENERVRQAKAAILKGDPLALGQIMTAAHASERDDFACSVEEVDFLVDTAIRFPGCYGARLTGGGFGGCTVNLVRAEETEVFAASIHDQFKQCFGLDADIYVCDAVGGAIARNEAIVANVSGGAE
ncbi:MAG TPA: galactokinase [Terracidiphilus sp.]|nr:galactokinase [Terracidiphilus sp.]